MRTKRFLFAVLLSCVACSVAAQGSEPKDCPEEPKKLNDAIEKSVNWYDVLPAADATGPLPPRPVLRWRNVVRGQVGEAMMVIWAHDGRPVAMASIYPWQGKMSHEFDSLSRQNKLIARDNDKVIWSPSTPGVEFKKMPGSPRPAKTAAGRLRQMKAIAERFKATMTGWQADNSDQEELRLLPRTFFRYEVAGAKDRDPNLLDGAMFAYVQGTDPEVVLLLEAIGLADTAEWQYAFVRATSGGLEVKLGKDVVWTALKHPAQRNPTLAHFTMRRDLER